MQHTLTTPLRVGMTTLLLAVALGAASGAAQATTGAVFTVNSNSDAGINGDGVCTLREAMWAASFHAAYHECLNSGGASGDDRIQFSLAAANTTIMLGALLPLVTGSTLTIDGSNAGHAITIDGAGAFRVFDVSASVLTLVNLTVQHGSASGGAGIRVGNATLTALRSAFLSNTATGGDAGAIICISGCLLTISNSTFAANSATGYGGAVSNNSGTVSIYNSTFTDNHAGSSGGAIAMWQGGASVPITTIYNSILANSTDHEDCYKAGTLSGDHNIIETSSGYGVGVNCAAITLSSADPVLAASTGSPAYYPLITGSPAIDTGDNTICAGAPVNNIDQRGMTRPVDGNFDATATCDIGAYEYSGHLFADVPVLGKEWMEPWVEMFYYNGITTGCGAGPLIYCPESAVTRAAMAVFILRAKHGASYVPPAATHTFSDMPVAGKEWMEPWVDQLYAEGITSGCGAGPIFCPENPVTRAAMAVFLLRALEGSSYTPPAATHTFSDMPVPARSGWSHGWTSSIRGPSPPDVARLH